MNSKKSNMKYSFYAIFLACCPLFFTNAAFSQGFAVNATGAPANASAIMDVSSTSQGMLIPRMTAAQRTAIASPVNGLLVYQTDGTPGFYFYNAGWQSLNAPGGSGTVTSVSNGDLSPVFTSSVANATTTPSITYTMTPSAQYSVLTNSTNATSTPGYGKVHPNALLALGGSANVSTFYRGDGQWQTPIITGMFNNQWVTVPSATTWAGLSSGQAVNTNGASADSKGTVMGFSGTVVALYVRDVYVAGSGSSTHSVTLYKNGVSTGMIVPVNLTTLGTAYSNFTIAASFTFVAGDYISIQLDQSPSTLPLGQISVTIVYTH